MTRIMLQQGVKTLDFDSDNRIITQAAQQCIHPCTEAASLVPTKSSLLKHCLAGRQRLGNVAKLTTVFVKLCDERDASSVNKR